MFVSKKRRKNFTPKSNEQFFSQTHMGASYACQICDTPIQVLLLKHVFLRCLKKNNIITNNQWSLCWSRLILEFWPYSNRNCWRILTGETKWFWNSSRIPVLSAPLTTRGGRESTFTDFETTQFMNGPMPACLLFLPFLTLLKLLETFSEGKHLWNLRERCYEIKLIFNNYYSYS